MSTRPATKLPRIAVPIEAVDRVWITTDGRQVDKPTENDQPGTWTTLYEARCHTGDCDWTSERDPSQAYCREQAAYHRGQHRARRELGVDDVTGV